MNARRFAWTVLRIPAEEKVPPGFLAFRRPVTVDFLRSILPNPIYPKG